MPENKKAWSSWNSSISNNDVGRNSITYWLNLLQNLNIEKNIFLTLNPYYKISEHLIYKKVYFTHPYYDYEVLKSQKELYSLQNKQNILFCGSYFGYGFHEDGIKSSIDIAGNGLSILVIFIFFYSYKFIIIFNIIFWVIISV